VTAAVLIGVDPGIADPDDRAARVALDAERAAALHERGLAAFVDDWQALPLFATQAELPAELRARVRAERLAHDRDGIAWSLRVLGLGRMPNLWPALASCAVPLRAITGSRDEKFTAIARRLETTAPRAHHRAALGAGHNVALEAPDVVADEIRVALREQELAA
jgi:2-succinyl-6-hydroxy-2,4-cyclohexadiene-1-carboxylate synthase